MTRAAFRDGRLGVWSSHPAFLVIRSRKWALAGFVPLAAGILLFVAAWRFGAVTLSGLAASWTTWLPPVLGLVALGFSAAVTVLLVGRASTVEAFQRSSGDRNSLSLGAFVALAGLIAGIAFALTRSEFMGSAIDPNAIASLRLTGHLLGTLPVFALLVYLEFAGASVDEWGNGIRVSGWRPVARRFYVVLGILAGYLLPMMWVDRIADSLDLYLEHLRNPTAVPSEAVADGILKWVPFLTYERLPRDGNVPVLSVLDGAQHMIATIAILVPLGCVTFFVVNSAMAFLRTAQATKQPVDPDPIVREEGYDLRPTGESWNPEDAKSRRPKAERWLPTSVGGDPGTQSEGESEPGEPTDDGGESSDPPPTWFSKLRESVASKQQLEWGNLRRAPEREFSRPSNRHDLAHLFATAFDPHTGSCAVPTADQVGALERFDKEFEEFLAAEDTSGQCIFPPIDMLVTGLPGSGRTTLLLAIAMNCVVLRGQSVLILVPTEDKAALHVRRLRDLASRGGVGWHVSVGRIRSDDVRSWADPLDQLGPRPKELAHRSPIGSLPDILVGTPQEYELHLFGADHHRGAVRRALLRMQAFLIEDVTTFSIQERRHLPFLIEKHRLVLAGEHLPSQFLALAPDLTEQAADYLTERLFSERAHGSVVRLRPPRREAPWLLDVASENPAETLEALATASIDSRLRVVLWQPGADAADRSRLQARLGASGRFRVVADLEELGPDHEAHIDIALYRTNTARQHTLALSSHIPGDSTVLIRVTRSGSLHAHPEPLKAFPVLPSVESEALCVSHLASALPYLAAFTPMPRDVYARMGLRTAGHMGRLPQRDGLFENFPGVSLVLDPPEHRAESVAASRNLPWAWVAMHVEGGADRDRLPVPAPRHVELLRPLARGRQMRIDPSLDRLYLGNAPLGDRSIVAWSTQQNESLDRMDLAYADDLLHRFGKSLFVPRDVRDEGSSLLIRGEPFRDRAHGESYFPILETAAFLPASVRMELVLGGVAPKMMRWANVREGRPEDGAIEVQWWLTGTYDAAGSQTPLALPVAFDYASCLGVLLLGRPSVPSGTTEAQRMEITRASLAGRWNTRRDQGGDRRARPWPILGLAVTSALREAVPSLFDYGRLVAYRGPADRINDGRAWLFFVEPVATRGTVASTIQKILGDIGSVQTVLQSARRSLEEISPEDLASLEFLTVDARFMVGGGWYEATSEGVEALETDLHDALVLLDSVMDEVGATRRRLARATSQRRVKEGGPEL